jgi:hypothetical protein
VFFSKMPKEMISDCLVENDVAVGGVMKKMGG